MLSQLLPFGSFGAAGASRRLLVTFTHIRVKLSADELAEQAESLRLSVQEGLPLVSAGEARRVKRGWEAKLADLLRDPAQRVRDLAWLCH